MSTLTAGAGRSALRRPWSRTARGSVGLEAGRLSARVARGPRPRTRENWSFASLSLAHESGTEGGHRLHLPNFAREARGRRQQAVCAISSPAIDVFPLNLQPSDSETLDSQVVSHARKLLSVPLSETVLDYVPLPDWVKRPTDTTVPVLVFSAARDVVEDLLTKTEELGFYVKRLMTPGYALAPLIAGAAPDARHLVIATSEEATSVSVAQNGHVLLERILGWSVNGIVELLRSEFDLEERQSRSLLARWDSVAGDTPVRGSPLSGIESFEGAVREVLAPAFRGLTVEAAGCLGYCGSFLQHASASEMVLVGPLANHALLRHSLESELGLTVRGPREGLTIEGQTDDPEWVSYATAACCAVACGSEFE